MSELPLAILLWIAVGLAILTAVPACLAFTYGMLKSLHAMAANRRRLKKSIRRIVNGTDA